jgi:hypothetical protein
MIGTIKRTTVSSGCIATMNARCVLTDVRYFTRAFSGTEERCDLLPTYNEVSTFVRQQVRNRRLMAAAVVPGPTRAMSLRGGSVPADGTFAAILLLLRRPRAARRR